MAPDELPEVMREMSAKGLGAAAIVDAQGRAIGIFTDGDLRRAVEQGTDLRALSAADPWCAAARAASARTRWRSRAATLMEDACITTLLVHDGEGRLVGALNTNDLMRAEGDLMSDPTSTGRRHALAAPDLAGAELRAAELLLAAQACAPRSSTSTAA